MLWAPVLACWALLLATALAAAAAADQSPLIEHHLASPLMPANEFCRSMFNDPGGADQRPARSRHHRRWLRDSDPGISVPEPASGDLNHYAFSPPPAPGPRQGHPVYIGLEIMDVDRINDAENYFSLQLHLFETWREPRLNGTALKQHWTRNGDPIPVLDTNLADCLWTPSLVFEYSTVKEHLLPPTSILLAQPDRVLLRKSRYSVKVRCHMNLQTYPMDKHSCHFKLRTFAHPIHRVELQWLASPGSPKPQLLHNKSVIFSSEFTPSLFNITVKEERLIRDSWLGDEYSVLDVEFVFERRIIHALLTVYIPSSLIVTLSWLQFWFDVEAVPGRMSLGIMSTLTIMTQILTNYEKAGNHVTAVDIWLFVCLIMVFLALMEYAVAYTISHYYDNFASSAAAPAPAPPPPVQRNRIDPASLSEQAATDRIVLAQLRILQASEELERLVQAKLAETLGLIESVRSAVAEVHRIKLPVDDNNNAEKPAAQPRAARSGRLGRLGQSLRRQLSSGSILQPGAAAATRLSQVDYGSRYLFPFAFVLFAAIYWVMLIVSS